MLDTGKGTRYIFTSWSDGDTSDKRTISHGGEYTAIYKTQHELIIDSLYSEPKGQGWHDEGSTAEISVKSIEEPTIKHIFTGWSGDYSGTEATVPIDVDSPMTITANWRTDYTYLYIAIASLAVGLAILVAIIITIVIRIRRKKKTI